MANKDVKKIKKNYFTNKETDIRKNRYVKAGKEEVKHLNEDDYYYDYYLYSDWVIDGMNIYAKELNKSQIRELLRINHVMLGLEKGEKVEIGIQDLSLLKEIVRGMDGKWNRFSQDILNFHDYIENL